MAIKRHHLAHSRVIGAVLVAIEDHEDTVDAFRIDRLACVSYAKQVLRTLGDLERLCSEVPMPHVDTGGGKRNLSANLTQVVRYGLLTLSDDQDTIVRLAHCRSTILVPSFLPTKF